MSVESSNTVKTHERLTAERLKRQRDAYTAVGFTLDEAMRLIEAALVASSIPAPVIQAQLEPARQAPGTDPLQPPYRFTCDHADVIAALVGEAGGFGCNGAGQLTIGNTVVPNS